HLRRPRSHSCHGGRRWKIGSGNLGPAVFRALRGRFAGRNISTMKLRFQFPLLTLFAVVTIIAVVCAYALSIVRGIKGEEHNLRARHVEATNTIRQVYAAFKRDSRWPATDEVAGGPQYTLPAGWVYDADESGPMLYLHGG